MLTPVGFTLGFWIIISSLVDPIDRWRRKLTLSRSILGMTVAHLGLALFVIGITSVESFTHERDIALAPGQTAQHGRLRHSASSTLEPIEGPNYSGVRGEFVVSREGKPIMTLHPEKRQYWVQRSVQTEAGIGTHRGTNILIALGEDLGAGKWSVRVQLRPLVNYVWIAAFIMALGGGIAASDRRYRSARNERDGACRHRDGAASRASRSRARPDDARVASSFRSIALRGARDRAVRRHQALAGHGTALRPCSSASRRRSSALPSLTNPGKTVRSKELQGKPYLLNVWGTWCGECRVEHQSLHGDREAGHGADHRPQLADEDDLALEWLAQLGNPVLRRWRWTRRAAW